ncbi:MAG: TetR/AcrR family transcriptional regulator, partial [Pseudomonadota bacterium]|nr:TetR/AcrR family transcriptional regulator [Pseudomonadota bacterium]
MARTQGSSSDITGPRIRRVAERLFAQAGFAAVSMRQIAGEVGVQAGALYNYTPDKQSLLFSLMERHLHEVLEGWEKLNSAGTPQEQLADFVRFHIGFHLERPDAVFIAYMELRNLTPENFARIEALRRRYETIPERILQAGIDGGDFAVPDPRVAT